MIMDEDGDHGDHGHGDDGHSEHSHAITIIVEGTPHQWSKKRISYDEVVTLEVPDYAQHPEITYSVKYKYGHGDRPEGTLSKGESVRVKDRMVFNVSETGQS